MNPNYSIDVSPDEQVAFVLSFNTVASTVYQLTYDRAELSSPDTWSKHISEMVLALGRFQSALEDKSGYSTDERCPSYCKAEIELAHLLSLVMDFATREELDVAGALLALTQHRTKKLTESAQV